MPKVKFVYLIASHNNIPQLERLVKAIARASPKSLVLIHHDYSSSYLDPKIFHTLENVQIIENFIPIKWGEFSQVEMELKCINWLFANSYEFDWLLFLSGQDYPVSPLNTIEEFYENTDYDGFIDYFPVDSPRQEPTKGGLGWSKLDTGKRRYFYRYYKLLDRQRNGYLGNLINRFFNRSQPLIKIIFNRSGIHLGIRRLQPIFNSDFKCYAGSNWHTLSYRCVCYIREYLQNNPQFIEYYQRTLNPDESFFQTILLNQTKLKIFNDNKRYIVWAGCTPYIWQNSDFQTLIDSQRHFARKFNTKTDSTILDRLDRHFLDNQQLVNK